MLAAILFWRKNKYSFIKLHKLLDKLRTSICLPSLWRQHLISNYLSIRKCSWFFFLLPKFTRCRNSSSSSSSKYRVKCHETITNENKNKYYSPNIYLQSTKVKSSKIKIKYNQLNSLLWLMWRAVRGLRVCAYV